MPLNKVKVGSRQMRRIQIVGLAVVAVFAFSAFTATSSFAAGKILLNGAAISSTTPSTMAQTVELEDMKAVGPPTILCSYIVRESISIFGVNIITEELLVLTSEALEVGSGKKEYLIECEDTKGICSSPVDVTAINLPWNGEVEKMAAGPEEYLLILLDVTGEDPGYTVDCNSILGLVSDTCTAEAAGQQAVMKNETGGLLAESSSNETTTPPGTCTVGGAKQGLTVSDGFISSTSGTLTVSE